jgi:hypothetical protein
MALDKAARSRINQAASFKGWSKVPVCPHCGCKHREPFYLKRCNDAHADEERSPAENARLKVMGGV